MLHVQKIIFKFLKALSESWAHVTTNRFQDSISCFLHKKDNSCLPW
jgi:hypothetical protein